jgi:hypothetical protein
MQHEIQYIDVPSATTLSPALAMPAGLGAQDRQDHKRHHYRLIDVGTFGLSVTGNSVHGGT